MAMPRSAASSPKRCRRSAMRASSPWRRPRPPRPSSKWSKACSSTAAISRPYFITNQDKMRVELEEPYVLIHEKKLSNLQALLPRARSGRAVGQAAADHCRGCRRRGACHARRQQAARRPEGRGGQGAGLRRPPQGHAGGHRHPHRRHRDFRGSRHQARERHAARCSAAPRRW